MEKDNINHFEESNEELYLLFIDEKRNKDLEKRFDFYINRYCNFNKKDISDNIINKNKENKENELEPKVIKFVIYQ